MAGEIDWSGLAGSSGWNKLFDRYYRKREIYEMAWGEVRTAPSPRIPIHMDGWKARRVPVSFASSSQGSSRPRVVSPAGGLACGQLP